MPLDGRKIKVSLFMRAPRPGVSYSIERLFDSIVSALPVDRFEVTRRVCPFKSKGLIRRLALIIWAACNQGDVNHVTGDVNFLGLLLRRSRTLLTIHDSASMRRLTGWRRWCYKVAWLQLPVWRAARVTVISERTLEETASYLDIDRARFSVIPNCVPQGMSADGRPFVDSRPRFLAVGTGENKNLPRIIEALAGLPCVLVIVGELSESHRKLLAQCAVEAENHVELDNASMADQYRRADAVVFVSTYEGFGLPILEAQSVGRPIVTSRRSPMQEVAGPGACLVDPESVDEIRAALLRITHDPAHRAALVHAGFENVKSYSPELVARQYASVYEELANG
jgi:glycosyltransferase involved in cell wall biosynthesis